MNKFLAKILTLGIRDTNKRRKKRKALIEGYTFRDDIKLVMTLLVKDEEEIIEKQIRFHKAMGVDGFIVTNNNSTDNTLQILNSLKEEGIVWEIIDEKDKTIQQHKWVDRMIKIAINKYQADWVINSDADEFYYSKDLNLKTSILKYPKLNAIKVQSTFSFPTEEQNFLKNPYFITSYFKDFEYGKMIEDNEYTRYFSYNIQNSCPKVLHSTDGYIMNKRGNHDVIMKDKTMGSSEDIVLYHYHIANYKRYEDKAKRWALSAKYLAPNSNHISNIVQLLNDNKLRDYYDCFYNEKMKNILEQQGIITKDFSVYKFMEHNNLL